MTLAKPGATFLCGRKGPTGRIAERIMSSEVRENGAGPVRTGTHAGHTDIEMALRSKPEGDFLLLTRLVRCRRASGPTADDAVLTLRSLFLWLRENRGHHYLSGGICRSKRLARDPAAGSVNEAAKPNIHNQTNRQENKQRSGTPVTHKWKRDAGHGHSADDHGHVY